MPGLKVTSWIGIQQHAVYIKFHKKDQLISVYNITYKSETGQIDK